MRILIVHNYYQQHGGEDTVFEAETQLLKEKGHEVITYTTSNKEIPSNKVKLAADTVWSFEQRKSLRELLKKEKPDVAHFHNTFMKISPSAYYACKEAGVPVVQSLHNPRTLCPAGSLRRNGKVCELCVKKTFAWPGIRYGCYRNSRSATATVATMLAFHKLIGTWRNTVDKYIVFTEFYRKKFAESGVFDPDQLVIKPHFIAPDPKPRPSKELGSYALFIGRLDPEKGVSTMLKAWKELPHIPLKIRGGGKMQPELDQFRKENPSHQIESVGRLSREDLISLMKGARFLVWPSEGYYETFGLVAADSLACGVPVIAARTGVLEENVIENYSGLHFRPGDSLDLREKVVRLWESPSLVEELGQNARQQYEERFTPEKNYEQLIEIYQSVIQSKVNTKVV